MMVFSSFILATVFLASDAADVVPEQIHLALAGKNARGEPEGMRVAWFTQDLADSEVQFGQSASSLTFKSQGSSKQYLSGHGYHHVALMNCSAVGIFPTSPTAPSLVYYRVGNSASMSATFSFDTRTFLADAPVSISSFGDMGWLSSQERPMRLPVDGLAKHWSAKETRAVLERLKNQKSIDGVFHVGDIGYMDDSFGHHVVEFRYEKAYNGYMNWLQNLTSTLPYMVSPGNHESECHSPACVVLHKSHGLPLSNFTAFNARWKMPSAESGGRASMWYSYSQGVVHFVSLNTETDFPGAGEEKTGDSNMKNLPAGSFGREGEYIAWLEHELAQASTARASGSPAGRPWLVAGGHRPYGDLTTNLGNNITIAGLLEKYGVDVYLSGHGHSYSRSEIVANKPVWVMAGGPGCDEMTTPSTEGYETTDYLKDNVYLQDGMSAPNGTLTVTSGRYSSGVLRANTTDLTWELVDSITGGVIDTFSLHRQQQCDSKPVLEIK